MYGALKRDGLAFFEVDQAPTQELKIASLLQAGVDASHVAFVSVDFSRDDAFEKLREAGYDPAKKTLFVWEGVTLYLDEADVRKTLQGVRERAAVGSVVVADIYGERLIQMGKKSIGKKALDYTDEGFGFGLPFATDFEATLARFIESEGMKQGETVFMGRTSAKGPFMVVAELCV